MFRGATTCFIKILLEFLLQDDITDINKPLKDTSNVLEDLDTEDLYTKYKVRVAKCQTRDCFSLNFRPPSTEVAKDPRIP